MSGKFTPIEQVLEFNAAYEKSGKTMVAFALENNLALHTAQWYRSRAKKHLSQAALGDSSAGFDLVADLPMASTGIALNVSGIRISLEANFSSSVLKRVLSVLHESQSRIEMR